MVHRSDRRADDAQVPGLVSAMAEKDALQLANRVARAARNGGRLLQFIGPQGGEGTSTIARDFALTLASRADRPLLLLDAGEPANGALRWFERQGAPLGASGVPALDGLRFHQVGQSALTIAEQLLPPPGLLPALIARPALLDGLRERFGTVVVDCPPLARSFDGVALAASMDATVAVLRAERTRAPVARDLCDRLKESGAQLVGFVFNRRRQLIPSFLYRRLG